MVALDKARIVSYEDKGKKFEILVDADIAFEVREGRKDFRYVYSDLLAYEDVYKDAGALDKISEKTLYEAFQTQDKQKIIETILFKGRLDLTTEQKRKIVEAKKKELIDYILRNSINPITKAPHTIQRIQEAIDKARIDIDLNKPISAQIDKIVEKLRPIIPMVFQTQKYLIKIPISYAGKVNGFLSKYEILERKWESEYFVCKISVPAGVKDVFLKSLDGLTQGKVVIEILQEN